MSGKVLVIFVLFFVLYTAGITFFHWQFWAVVGLLALLKEVA